MSDQNTILPDILTDETKIFILSTGAYENLSDSQVSWSDLLK